LPPDKVITSKEREDKVRVNLMRVGESMEETKEGEKVAKKWGSPAYQIQTL